MAVHDKCVIVCPKCGHKQEIDICGLLSIFWDVDLMSKLLEGGLTTNTCNNCDCNSELGLPLTVSTPGIDGVYIYYVPSGTTYTLVNTEKTKLNYVLEGKCWKNDGSETYQDWDKFVTRLKELLAMFYEDWEEKFID